MKYIFHTAQCGSSVLTALLGTVNYHTYSEPSWSHQIIKENLFPESYPSLENQKDFIVKLPSGLCCTSVATNDPKLFLYRKFKDHIYRHLIKGESWPDANYFYKYETDHAHPELRFVDPVTCIEKIAFFWLNDVLWLTEASNTFWVHSDDLFLKTSETLEKTCKFFDVDPIKSFGIIDYDVKQAGLKGSDFPIADIAISEENLLRRNIKNSVVLRPFRDACPQVAQTLKWIENSLDKTTIDRLSPYIYD